MWSEDILGTKQFLMCRKLNLLKLLLKRRAFGHISDCAERARGVLEAAQKHTHDLPDNEQARMPVNQAKVLVIFLDKVWRSFYNQKSKCSYIRERDQST